MFSVIMYSETTSYRVLFLLAKRKYEVDSKICSDKYRFSLVWIYIQKVQTKQKNEPLTIIWEIWYYDLPFSFLTNKNHLALAMMISLILVVYCLDTYSFLSFQFSP